MANLSERGKYMTPPAKSEVLGKLQMLANDEISREDAASWAQQWVFEDEPSKMPKEIWKALKFICGADMISIDRPYLYGREDFEDELAKLS